MPPDILYFAYGSNLRSAQMNRLCPGHQFLGPARLAAHRLAFTRPDEEWQGGVADLLPAGGQEVWGALYRLTPADLAGLDAYEGFDPSHRAAENAYLRRTIEVTGTDGAMHSKVWSYFVQQPLGHHPPSALYGHALLAGARERQLPPSYIKTLSALLRPEPEN